MIVAEESDEIFRIRFAPFDLVIVCYLRMHKDFPNPVHSFDFFSFIAEHSMDIAVFFNEFESCFWAYFFQTFIVICPHADSNIYKLFPANPESSQSLVQFDYFRFDFNVNILSGKLTLPCNSKVPDNLWSSEKK